MLFVKCIYVPTLNKIYLLTNRIGGVMVSVLALSTVDRGIEPHSDQTRDYKIGICWGGHFPNFKLSQLLNRLTDFKKLNTTVNIFRRSDHWCVL